MKTKELLYVWKSFLCKDMISEISIKRFQEQNPDFDTSMFTSQLRGNTDYLDIINNSIASGQQHSPDDYLQQFEFYKNTIEPNRNNQEFLTINIPGESDPVSLVDKVAQGSCTATFDDIQQFQQARLFALGKGSKNNLAAAYAKVLEEASQNDFELIVDNSDWVIYYPKSIRGSIALARSYWDGSKIAYDNTFNPSRGFGKNVGNMNWCTSVSGQGNMFLNYHRKQNLHMYYCIKKKVLDINDETRKLCISYSKTGEDVKLSDDRFTIVNANNNAIDSNYINRCIGNKTFKDLRKDVMLPKRKEVDMNSFYESISLEQYITLRNANEENIEDFINEFSNIIRLSKDKEKIKSYSLNDDSEQICSVLIGHINSKEETLFLFNKWKDSRAIKRALLYDKKLPLEIIQILLNDESYSIRETASQHPTNLKHDLSTNDLSYLREKSVWYKKAILNNKELLSPEVLEVLASDENPSISSLAIYVLRRKPSFESETQLENKLIKDYIKLFLS